MLVRRAWAWVTRHRRRDLSDSMELALSQREAMDALTESGARTRRLTQALRELDHARRDSD